MSTEVRLPELGDSVTHAKLTKWLKREGDRVLAGEPIAEVETDKTNVEVEAPGTGVLVKIHVGEGTDGVPVDTILALIADAGQGDAVSASTVAVPAETPRTDSDSGPRSVELLSEAPRGGGARSALSVHGPSHLAAPDSADSDIPASPLARSMAHAAGIPLTSVRGTGPGRRITKRDIDAVLQPAGPVASAAPTPAIALQAVESADGAYELRPLSAMRRVTAERLAQSKQTIPHFYMQTDCDVQQVSQMRNELNARSEEKISLTAFLIRAAALALQKIPSANSTWANGAIRVYGAADIAVAIDTPSGLIAPVIRQAERKSVLAIAREMRALADRARAGKLKPEEYSGGTFTLSNLGMYGVGRIYPIINPPQSCILGVGAVEERPVVRDRAVVPGLVMTCTLSADHRAIDGAAGAEFLGTFRRLIENPWGLVL